MYKGFASSVKVCYLGHFFMGSKKIKKNLYLETFSNMFNLLQKGTM